MSGQYTVSIGFCLTGFGIYFYWMFRKNFSIFRGLTTITQMLVNLRSGCCSFVVWLCSLCMVWLKKCQMEGTINRFNYTTIKITNDKFRERTLSFGVLRPKEPGDKQRKNKQ